LNTRIKLSLTFVTLLLLLFAWALAVCFANKPQDEKPTDKKSNSNGNSLCYVCHFDLQTEEIATAHLKERITCDKCHGPSAHHMHDEMLMTKPDLLFGRAEVEQMCKNCHQPHKNPAAVEAFRKKWLGRARPNGRTITAESVCTDCHGTHNIIKQMGAGAQKEQPTNWVALFNGRDLTGWKTKGSALWAVERGRLIAKPGPKGAGGGLLTQATYEDYRLSVTFRTVWPIHAGIWLRHRHSAPGPRVEIFESKNPRAFTGSVLIDGKNLVLANLQQDLFNKEGWNTISVEVREKHFKVWLNGEEIGAFRPGVPAPGQIGFHIENQPENKKAVLTISEVLVQRLDELVEEVATPPGD
jgi:hypothetical protein